MSYTDYNQVLQDLADNIREVNGTSSSIRFVDMPDLISSFISSRIYLDGEYSYHFVGGRHLSTWKRKLIPFADTSGMTDMHNMLKGVDTLNQPLDLSHFDTSNVTDMSHMFQECIASSINLSSFDTSKVTNMSEMFRANSSYIDVSNFDTSNVTDMSGMFYSANNVNISSLSNFDTSNVTDMSFMFRNFYYSGNLDLSHFNTSKVILMAETFDGLHNLSSTSSISLNVTGWDVSNVTNFGACFCESDLTELDLSGWQTPQAQYMQNMFWNSGIRKIWVPSTFVATRCSSEHKPFRSGPNHTCHIYTDASQDSATYASWGPVNQSIFEVHFNSTHEDYENA